MGKLSKLKNALDMSTAARMQRAAEQSMNTGRRLYHGTGRDFPAFDVSKGERHYMGKGVHLAESPGLGSNYAGQWGSGNNVIPVFTKSDLNLADESTYSKYYHAIRAEMEDGVYGGDRDWQGELAKRMQADGYDGVRYNHPNELTVPSESKTVDVIFDPSNIRSVHAAFDPANIGKNDLLGAATMGGMATAGAVGAGLMAAQTGQQDAITRHHLDNLKSGKYVRNADNSVSTVRTIGVNINGRETLIPTVWDGKILSDKEAVRRAIESGVRWPTADTPEELQAIDEKIHVPFESDIREHPDYQGLTEKEKSAYKAFGEKRQSKQQFWKELKEAGATIASAIPASIVSDAYRIGGYLSPVTTLDETEQGAQAIQGAMTVAPSGDNRFLNEIGRQVDQFGRDIEPLVDAWQQTPIYKGYKQLPERAQRLIGTATEYLF